MYFLLLRCSLTACTNKVAAVTATFILSQRQVPPASLLCQDDWQDPASRFNFFNNAALNEFVYKSSSGVLSLSTCGITASVGQMPYWVIF